MPWSVDSMFIAVLPSPATSKTNKPCEAAQRVYQAVRQGPHLDRFSPCEDHFLPRQHPSRRRLPNPSRAGIDAAVGERLGENLRN
jgi:hypothetical protein